MRSRGRDENIARGTVPGSPQRRGEAALLQGRGLGDFAECRDQEQVVARPVEPLEQALRWCDVQSAARPLDEPFTGEPAEHERDRFARSPYQLAEQTVARAA